MKIFSAVYDSYHQAERTVEDLEAAGIPHSEISLIANKYVSDVYENVEEVSGARTGAGVGAAVGGGAGLLAGIGLLAIPGLGPVVAAGWLAATAVGAIAGTAAGGIVGALVDAGTDKPTAEVYSETVRRGGTLVTVRSANDAVPVQAILDRHSPVDAAARRREYEQAGWVTFDPSAPAVRPDAATIERMRRRYD